MSSKITQPRIGSKIIRKPLFFGLFIIVFEAKLADYVISSFYPSFVLWTIASAFIQVFILYLAIHIAVTTATEVLHKQTTL